MNIVFSSDKKEYNTIKKGTEINIEVFVEEMYAEIREKAVSGDFTMVAIDEEKKPVKIFE